MSFSKKKLRIQFFERPQAIVEQYATCRPSTHELCKNLTWFCKTTLEVDSIDPRTGYNEATSYVVFMKSPPASQSSLLLLEVLQIDLALSTI